MLSKKERVEKLLEKVTELKHSMYNVMDALEPEFEDVREEFETNYPFDKDFEEVFAYICDWEQSIADSIGVEVQVRE